MALLHRRDKMATARREAQQYTELRDQLRAAEPQRTAQREEARALRKRGEASQQANHFGETLEKAMRDRRQS